jgi:hypothetical protein
MGSAVFGCYARYAAQEGEVAAVRDSRWFGYRLLVQSAEGGYIGTRKAAGTHV